MSSVIVRSGAINGSNIHMFWVRTQINIDKCITLYNMCLGSIYTNDFDFGQFWACLEEVELYLPRAEDNIMMETTQV